MEILKRLYSDPCSPGSYSGVENLWAEALKHDPSIRRKDVAEFLESERTYTLYKRRRIRYKRLRTVPSGLMTDVQADLMEFQKLAKDNDGMRYVLLAVDVMSRRIFCVPVESKHNPAIKAAFDEIFQQMGCRPWTVYTDKGLIAPLFTTN